MMYRRRRSARMEVAPTIRRLCGAWLKGLLVVALILASIQAGIATTAIAQPDPDTTVNDEVDEAGVEQPDVVAPAEEPTAEAEPAAPSEPVPAPPVDSPTPAVPTQGPAEPSVVLPTATAAPPTETPLPTPTAPLPTPTLTALPGSGAPLPGATGPGGTPASCTALVVSTAQNNYMTGDYISWQASGFAPTSFVKHNVRLAPWRGEAADSPGSTSLGVGTATVTNQCIAGQGASDAWLIPQQLPAGRYVVVVTGYKASDPTSLISLASPEFTIGPRTPQGANPGGSDRPTCYPGPYAYPPCTPTPRPN